MLAADTEEELARLHSMLKEGDSARSTLITGSLINPKWPVEDFFKWTEIEIQHRHSFCSELHYDSLMERRILENVNEQFGRDKYIHIREQRVESNIWK